MATGKHGGAFAKGFSDSITKWMQLYLQQQHYEALNKHYAAQEELWANRGLGKNKGLTPDQIAAGQQAGRDWDKGGGGDSGGGGAYKGGAQAEAHAAEMSDYLQKNYGLTKAGAAGVVGNAWQESSFASNFKPGGDKGSASGMFQWRGDRQTDARNWMAQNGKDPNAWQSHLDYAMHETQRDYPSMMNQLKTTNDPEYATHEFFHVFERGDPKQANFANRDGMAQAAMRSAPATTQTAAAPTTDRTGKVAQTGATAPTTPTKGPNKGKQPATKVVDAPPKTASRDDTKGEVQTASLDDDAGMRAFLKLHPEAAAGPAKPDPDAPDDGGDAVLKAEAARRADPRDQPQPSGRSPPPIVNAQDRTVGDPAQVREEADRAAAHPDDQALPPAAMPPSERPGTQFARPQPSAQPLPVTPTQQGPEGPRPPWSEADQPALPPVPTPGPAPIVNTVRPEAPPLVTARPSTVGEDNPATRNMPYPGQADPKGVYAPKPNPIAIDRGARPDLTARSPAISANVPSNDAQPVNSPALPSNPQGNTGGFVTIDRPNAGPNERNRGSPQGTALDLSHLWGPNPPLSQQQQPATSSAPPPAPTRPPDDDMSSAVGSPNMDDVSLGMQLGAAKGGSITKRYANGGAIPTRPTMKFAAAGAVPYATYDANPAPSMGMFNAGAYANANMQPWRGGAQWLGSQSTSPYSAQAAETTPGGQEANYNALPAYLQTWYNQQNANAMSGGGGGSGNQWFYNPDSIPTAPAAATAAPAAAAPAATVINPPSVQNITNYPASTTNVDPTTTTVTGAVKTPNSIQAKSYDPNVDAQTGAGFANTSNTGGTDYSVGTDDLLKQNASGQISGDGNTNTILSRKGGPINRFANGGGIPSLPTMRYATGGATGANPAYEAILQGTYNGPTAGGGWMGTPQSQLAPNQQTWATQQQNIWGQIDQATAAKDANARLTGINQLTMMPDAIWPTAAPTTPSPIATGPNVSQTINTPITDTTNVDPTTTTVTGGVKVPNAITAKSYDPNVDAQTGAGFANTSNTGGTDYSVGSDDLLKQNDSGQISGDGNTTILSRKGGPIPRVTRRVSPSGVKRYDDGGGVSPSAAGMPPGLGGQGAIPPIYYNPATYAGAGAPVGKGISQNSAPTFGAGAIPSLPMARGGVVKGYDDGGDVSPTPIDYNEDMQTAQDDRATTALLDQRDAENTPTAPLSGAPASGYFTPADYQTPAQTSGSTGAAGPPAGAAPWTPEISDGQGNPSKGLIGAIGDGLHWLGAHLGLTGGGPSPAIANNPSVQGNRANFAKGQNVGDHSQQQQQQLESAILGPNGGGLNAAERQIAVMEGTYKYMLSQGDSAGAAKMAASILQYSVQTSQSYAEEAAKQLYDGNLQGAVDNINHASDAVPDGRLTHVSLNPDGTAIVTGKDMNGRTLWQQKGSAEAILQYATNRGKTGQMQWDALESQAAKYDPTFRDMASNRTKNIMAQGKEDAANASAGRVDASGANTPLQPVTRTAAAPAAPTGPSGTPASAPAPAAPAIPNTPTVPSLTPPPVSPVVQQANVPVTRGVSGDGGGTAQAAAAPPDADQGSAPPPTPSAPSEQAQPVSFEDAVARIGAQETQTNNGDLQRIRANYISPQGNIIYGGQEYARPQPPDTSGMNPVEQRETLARWKVNQLDPYNAMVTENQKAMAAEVAENKDLRGKQFQTLRDRAREQFTEGQKQEGAVRQSQRDAILNTQKAQLDEHNATYADQMKRETPRNDTDARELLADVGGSSFVPLARALLPDQSEVADDKAARTALASAGYDAGTQRTIKQAFDNGLRYSSLSSRDEVAAGIAQLAQGKDGKGQYDKRTDTYHISVANDDGSISRVTLPASDALNLQKTGYKIATAQAIKGAKDRPVETRPSGPGTALPMIPSVGDWYGGRSPAEQTSQPPM